MTHHFNSTILREYDIRGVVGDTLFTADARALGRVFGTTVRRQGGRTVVVGYDGRVSGPAMESALIEGLQEAGIDIVRIGRGPTPMVYFAVKHLGADAGVMVTGSHNPAQYNGFKMLRATGPVYGAEIQMLGQMAASDDVDMLAGGSVRDTEVKADYIARLARDYAGTRDQTIVWDCGNGAAGDIVPDLIKILPGKHHVLFADVDGTFPNHHPDPTVAKNLVDLQRAVNAYGADIGVAFDGDGDRIGAVDGKGRIIWGDQLLALYAREVLADEPGATIIADVKASQALFDEIARLGGVPLMWKTGHSLIKAKMAETNAPLAGEMSGHIFFRHKYYGFDDGLYCAVRLLSLVAAQEKPLWALYDELPTTMATPEMRIPVSESRKFGIITAVKEKLSQQAGLRVNDIDGVRVTNDDGWWLLRASNTGAVLVARAEGHNEQALARLERQIRDTLAAEDVAFVLADH